ncbi:TylF/MycF/NovP-related O-methyltransferase, partial [Candidatus Omnitrophota bacterium]
MIKNLIKSAIAKSFNLIGHDVAFSEKEPYFIPNNKMQLYLEGLKQSHVEWSDNFYKQLRYYSLQQIVCYILRQELIGDFVECGTWKGHSAYIISRILSENKFTRNFHIFDSFEGGLSDKVGKDKNLRFELSEKQIKTESNTYHS